MDVLKVAGLRKNFGGLQVLQDISFTLYAGERLALIGPNGAGKTTLIKVLSGNLAPTRGAVYILGRNVTRIPVYRRLHLGLACSFQLNNLFFSLTVMENILLALQGRQSFYRQLSQTLSPDEARFAEIRKLLEGMDIWPKRNLPVTSLSYGEQRMIEIALGLASAPKILLLDEPSAGLSETETDQIIGHIRRLPAETAVLFVSHDMDVVFDLAHRILVLNYGTIIAEGRPEEIQADQNVREIYLGG